MMDENNPYSPNCSSPGTGPPEQTDWLIRLFFIIPLAILFAFVIGVGLRARSSFELLLVGVAIVVAIEFARIAARLRLDADYSDP